MLPKLLLAIGFMLNMNKVSVMAMSNSVQAYLTLHYTKQVYLENKGEVTKLSSRTFGTWTFLSAVIRFYGAYYISNPQIYQLTFITYVVAALHFVSEWRVYKTASWGRGLAGPIIVANGTLIWMVAQRNFYIY